MATAIRFLCDICLTEDQEVDGQQVVVALGKTARAVELCDPHRDQFVTPLEEMLRIHGRPADAAPKVRQGAQRARQQPQGTVATRTHLPVSERPVVCFLDDATFTSESGLRQHLGKMHNTNTLGLFGHTCPLCLNEVGAHWNRHIHAEHPEHANVTQAFVWARDNGDPHGVVKERQGLF